MHWEVAFFPLAQACGFEDVGSDLLSDPYVCVQGVRSVKF